MERKSFGNSKWKIRNRKYLFELQKFLDLADNIQDEKLRKLIINQMIRCDKCITNIAEKRFKKLKYRSIHKMGE